MIPRLTLRLETWRCSLARLLSTRLASAASRIASSNDGGGLSLLAKGTALSRGRIALVLGLALMPVYLGSVMAGSAIFDPARDRVYRWTAYAIIAASAIGGLPLFD